MHRHTVFRMLNRLLFVLVHVCMRWFWTIEYIKMVQCFSCDTFLFTFQCLSLGGKFHSCSFVFSLFTYWFALRSELNFQNVEKHPNHRRNEQKCDNVQVQIVAPVSMLYSIATLAYNTEWWWGATVVRKNRALVHSTNPSTHQSACSHVYTEQHHSV